MTLCWSRDPGERPSAKEIVEFAERPEFCALYNVVMLENEADVLCACSVRRRSDAFTEGKHSSLHCCSCLDAWLVLPATIQLPAEPLSRALIN